MEPESVKPVESVNLNYFNFLFCIGRGGFGKVWKVRCKRTNIFYAMKEMEKARIMSR